MIKYILFFVLLIIAFANFFPTTYDNGREWAVDKLQQSGREGASSVVDKITDIANFVCETNQDCIDEFGDVNMRCSSFQQCYVQGGAENVSG